MEQRPTPAVKAARPAQSAGAIGYVLTGFPRLSETFIASEIHRLERHGLHLRLFVLKLDEHHAPHPVVERIVARPEYLPPTTSFSRIALMPWLVDHLPSFLPGLVRVARWRPRGLARAAGAALAQTQRTWRGRLLPPKAYVKEFLQATALADRVRAAPEVRHLHAHFCHATATVTWLASMITGIPFSFTAHARDLYEPALNPAGLLDRKLRAARFAVTCTEIGRAELARRAPGVPVHRIYHGLNADLAGLLANDGENAEIRTPPRMLGVGRVVAKKGFDVFVEACALVRGKGIPFEADIVGEDGAHGDEVRRRIALHGLAGAVRLVGPLPQEALLHEYRRASVFCLPCRVTADGDRDGIPNVLVEAMACGVPVVSTRISGIPELITDGVTGLLVPPEDPGALADAIERLHRDPALARRLARAGREAVLEHFDAEREAERLATLFRPLVSAP